MKRYKPSDIEPKWQKVWDKNKTYQADLNSKKQKYIAMGMFNYPSGAGIHIGHAMNFTIPDVLARFKRQQGYESYHPVGWDSFGLPAENYAIKAGVSPQESMATIIPNYHKQYKAMGWSNDWSKEISTHEPSYYKWTQWIFAEMFRAGMAYQDVRMQWFCEKCQTVLANEQVIDGKCWRHDGADDPEVTQREVKQWFFKVTEYADELLDAIDDLDWSQSVKDAQKNWIGRSQGSEIDFKIDGEKESIKVFTTRPDTLFGATFLVVAPEHEIVNMLSIPETKAEVDKYVKDSAKRTDLERQTSKEKTGVFTGSYAINPINEEKIPIWVADYVLVGYGTGAIMAVPAHDERDYEFAKKFVLPIVQVIRPVTGIIQEKPEYRRSIVAILRNPKDDSVLSINWGNDGGNIFIGGGREESEEAVDTAIREIREETGYKNVRFVSETPAAIEHHYFAHSKNVARRIDCIGLLFELENDERDEQKLEADEQGRFSIQWLKPSEIELKVKDELHITCYRQLVLGEIFSGEGLICGSGAYDGLSSSQAREKIVEDLAKQGVAEEKTIFKIRDWSVTRQRYWGAPTPIIHCPKCGPVLVPDAELPVILPELKDYAPSGDGRSALGRADKSWLNAKCPECGEMGERETDTLDTYICSSWYMLRYFDSKNEKKIFDSSIVNKWMPIDFYNGADHATAHMIYARFITRFFHKQGLVDNPEPFKKFLFNGKVTASDGKMFGKSKGNGVDPLEIINDGYGADALRIYLMFAAPLDIWIRWDPQGVPGAYRFINRVWNIVQEFIEKAESSDVQKSDGQNTLVLKAVHPVIKKVTSDLEDQKYNTAIAALMKCTNDLYEIKARDGFAGQKDWLVALESLVMLMAPLAPHAAEELWQDLGHKDSVHVDHWPEWDEKYLVHDTMTIVVQVNGKVRAELEVSSNATEEDIKAEAVKNEKVQKYLEGKEPKKIIYVTGRLVSLVV